MPIAYAQFEGIGARIYAPEGPFGTNPGDTPIPSFRPGEVIAGDARSEFEYVYLNIATAGTTVNQGDVYVWDQTFQAVAATTTSALRGMRVGTFFCGGNFAGGAISSPFSFTFPVAGLYGVWMQRAGATLFKASSTAVNTGVMETTATAGQINEPASATATTKSIVGSYVGPASITFTANTTTASVYLTNVSSAQFLEVGGTISGSGIPTGTIIKAINGATITMSNAATATATGVTVTRTAYSTYVTTTNGSPVLTNVTTINGIYPNQTIAGTGIPASTTIVSIQGNPGNYTITMSANATATANNINATTNGYFEGFIDWAYVDKTN